jgi:hypothetical protein
MKKPILGLIVPLFAAGCFLVTCKPKTTQLSSSLTAAIENTRLPVPVAGDSKYVALSSIALHAAMLNPNTSCDELRALYNEYISSMCSLTATSLMTADLCPCPDDANRLCPCPGDSTTFEQMFYAAPMKYNASVSIDGRLMPASSIGEKLTAFAWPETLPNGLHTITLKGNFAGKGGKERTYSLKVEVKMGKAYLLWKK